MAIIREIFQSTEPNPILIKLKELDRKRADKAIAVYEKKKPDCANKSGINSRIKVKP